jgi:RHS repeat-associated protein
MRLSFKPRLLNNTLVATYAVDGNSLRVSKVWNGSRTWYLYAGTQLISEYEDAASATYNPGTNAGGAGSDGTATILYQHGDHLTTRLTTDNSGLLGNVQAHYPYGETISSQTSGTADPSVLRKFTSYLREEETDATGGRLNYAIFREHSARIGRFLMADPVQSTGNPQRMNRYGYTTGDPVNRTDSRGLDDKADDIPRMEGGNIFGILDQMLMAGVPGRVNGELMGTPHIGPTGRNLGSCSQSTSPTVMFLPAGAPQIPSLSSLLCGVPQGGGGGARCFAQLKSRPAEPPYSSICKHTFWWVQDRSGPTNGRWIISGHPVATPGLSDLDVSVGPGNSGTFYPQDNSNSHLEQDFGLSEGNCAKVDLLLAAANLFPRSIPYRGLHGPNSNSAARYLGERGGFNPREPVNACGWGTPILPRP